ncbi:MAG: response regulator transcription factor [Oscillospiraceae bacterium]|nr:response regulator transcription factor [Oscillospiraceae bacterium]
MRVLVVEDEKRLADAIKLLLEKEKIITDVSYNGIDGLDNALSAIYDVIILDVMLPGMDGFSVIENIRKEGIETPVMMLTAKSAVTDKVKGLDRGADDYLTKPFVTEELLARVRALGRRSTAGIVSSDELSFGDLKLDTASFEVSCGQKSVKLGLKEYSILEMLMINKGNAISKDMLITKIWGYDSDAQDNNVEVYVSFLRKKLSFLGSKTAIKTLRGIGYKLESEEENND